MPVWTPRSDRKGAGTVGRAGAAASAQRQVEVNARSSAPYGWSAVAVPAPAGWSSRPTSPRHLPACRSRQATVRWMATPPDLRI